MLAYNSTSLQYLILDKEQIGKSVSASGGLGSVILATPLCYLGKNTLDVVLNSYSLQDVLQSQVLAGYMNINAITGIFWAADIQNAFASTAGLNGIINLVVNQSLGIIIL